MKYLKCQWILDFQKLNHYMQLWKLSIQEWQHYEIGYSIHIAILPKLFPYNTWAIADVCTQCHSIDTERVFSSFWNADL